MDTTFSTGTVVLPVWLNDVNTTAYKRVMNVHDTTYGAVGDGTTDDSTAIAAAFAAATTNAGEVHFQYGKTYALGSQLVIPAGAKVFTHGCTFKDLTGTAGSSPLITIDDNTTIVDDIAITVPTGITRTRSVSLNGDNIKVYGDIKATYTDQQAPSVNDDAAIRIVGCNRVFVFGRLITTKNDRGVQIHTSTEVTVAGMSISTYVRGLLIEDSTDVFVGKSKITTISPNASYTAGHVGVLLSSTSTDATRNITLEDFRIEDSGEHGIRLGGPEQMSNIYLVRVRTKNTGGSGIKILGTDSGAPTASNQRIYIDNPIIEDCGTGGLTTNMCGILVMFCVNVMITNPTIRKGSKIQCGYHGIRICASSDVVVTSPDVSDATSDNIVVDATLADCTRITINGGITRTAGRDGIRSLTGTGTIRRLVVDGLVCDSNAAYGAFHTTSGGTTVACKYRVLTYNNTTAPASCDSTAVAWNGSGLGVPGWTAADGSIWQTEGTDLYRRKAGAWAVVP